MRRAATVVVASAERGWTDGSCTQHVPDATELIIVQGFKTTAELPKAEPCDVQAKMALVEVDEVIKKCAPNEKVAEEMRTHIRHTREDGQVPVLMMARDGYSKLYGLMAIKEGEMDN